METKKEPEKHVHKSLTTGKEIKKSAFQKAIGLFLAEDADMVSESLMDDFIRPRLKKFSGEMVLKGKEFLSDSLIALIQMIIFGKTSNKNGSSSYTSSTGRVNYMSYYNGQPVVVNNYTNQPDKDTVGITLYTIPSAGKAEEVLTELVGIIKRYKHATVADYYQLLDVTPAKTDWNYGWFDLDDATIVRYKNEGYVINFPKPIAL